MPRNGLVVGIDVDGVLADFDTAFYWLLNSLKPGLSPPGVWSKGQFHPDTWDWAEETYPPEIVEQAWQMVKDPAERFWLQLHPTPHAEDLIPALWNHEAYAITSRPGKTAYPQTREWLDTYGFDGALIIARGPKGPIAASVGLTHFLDDKPENCQSVTRSSPSTHVWLLRQRHNTWFSHAKAAEEGIAVAETAVDFIKSLRE
jgi:hypothetical protein